MSDKLIYFLRPVGMNGPVKVGCSCLPEKRLKAIDIWSPFPLEIIAICPGDFDLERAIHWHMRDHRLHGEWFEANPKLCSLLTHIGRNGCLPPLEASPYGKTKMGRGRNPNRNPKWGREKARVTMRIHRAESRAYWHWPMAPRPNGITQIMDGYQGPFSPPPTPQQRADLEGYVTSLMALPADPQSRWRNWKAA